MNVKCTLVHVLLMIAALEHKSNILIKITLFYKENKGEMHIQ